MKNFRLSRGHVQLAIFFVCILLICIGALSYQQGLYIQHSKSQLIKLVSRQELNEIVQRTTAKSALVYDLRKDEVVVGKNVETDMSLASITKIFTSGLAYETFLKDHTRHEIDTTVLLNDIQNMMAASSNEEAERISQLFGYTQSQKVAALNAYTSAYNLSFKNVSGLDLKETREVGGTGKAIDVAQGIKNIYFKYPEIFDKTILPYGENTNLIAGKLGLFLAGKTGFTEYSGGNLAVIVQKGLTHKYLIIVLGSTENGRFVDVEAIAKALLQLSV